MNARHEGLRLALFNPINPSHPIAERELALRLARSMGNLGWEGRIVSRAGQVGDMDPDAVLCLHPQATAKLSEHPWLACYWNPSSLLEGASATVRAHGKAAEQTYDAYLVSGPVLQAHLTGLMRHVRRDPPLMPFHVSSPRSTLAPNLGPHSRLFYVGSNWDGRRYPTLLRQLSMAGVLALHGTPERWSHLPDAFQGPLPFDGHSVIAAAHHWGMGLCLHLPQHRAEGVPNMRVFELAAAGALILADRHPFIESWFGDSVLYVDTDGGEEELAAVILDRLAWAGSHMREAREMAVAAQAIFNGKLCLEKLLEPLPDLLAELPCRQQRTTGHHVGVLLPGNGGLDHRLEQLASQMAASPGLTLTALVPEESVLPAAFPAGVGLRRLGAPVGMTPLLVALEGMEGLAVLPEGLAWHAGHLAGLIANARPGGAAVAAGLWPMPAEPSGFPIDPAESLALALPDERFISEDRWSAWTILRAGGVYCGVGRLLGLAITGQDWADWALELPPALAASGGLDLQPVPSLRLTCLPAGGSKGPRRQAAWDGPDAGKPAALPRFAGISDLNPVLASSLPFLWRPDDFAQLPPTGPIWLYGAGQGGELVMEGLPPDARARVRGFLDSHRRGDLRGLPLLRPEDVAPAEMAAATIIIAAQYVSEIIRTLRRGPVAPAVLVNAYPYIAETQEMLERAKVKDQAEAQPPDP